MTACLSVPFRKSSIGGIDNVKVTVGFRERKDDP